MVSVQHSSPGRTVRVALLLVTELDVENTMHCTVVPLFAGIAGTVRADCTVPDDGGVEVILALVASTIHPMAIPLPAQWNRAFSPTSALTDSGRSVSAIENKTRYKQETLSPSLHTGSTSSFDGNEFEEDQCDHGHGVPIHFLLFCVRPRLNLCDCSCLQAFRKLSLIVECYRHGPQQRRRQQQNSGGADCVRREAAREILLINIHEECVFRCFRL